MAEILPDKLHEIHCVECKRYLGLHNIIDGEVYLYCPNCKNYTIIIRGNGERPELKKR